VRLRISVSNAFVNQSRWPHDLRTRSAAARLLPCEFESYRGRGCLSVGVLWVLSRGLCVGLITSPEEFYLV
jgi:hypothetical protein